MLIFTWASSPPHPPPPAHPPHPALALALPVLLSLLLLVQALSWAIQAARSSHTTSPHPNHSDEAHRHLLPQQQPSEPSEEHDARTAAKRTGLELSKTLLCAVMWGVCLMKIVGRPVGAWEGVLDGGVGGVAIYIAVVSFASLIWTEWAQVVRRQQIILFGALVLVLGLKDVSCISLARSPASN
ncbi:hypothetical protein BCR35DRAFT_79985 [Leucosporidium creatinivorum]|uniref:Uncharacterized protein n=1 Tax=Leucosporidium creatinivorum TaxID=106004 RepID=A0A1Y2FJM1_9BASI|nr:hypothetical protein BCR35DRAFT_79985 [Leucosporidium creatinivorum]